MQETVPEIGNTDLEGVEVIGQTVWAVGEGDLVLSSSDHGGNFANKATGFATELNNFRWHDVTFRSTCSVNPQNGTAGQAEYLCSFAKGLVVGSFGKIGRSTNSGSAWSQVTVDKTSRPTINLGETTYHAVTGLGGFGWTLDWISGDNGVILVSTDAGANWRISVPPAGVTEKLYGLFMLNKTFGYAVGANGIILMTTDSGTVWSRKVSGVTTDLRAVKCFDSGNKCWAVGDSGAVLFSSNLGPAGQFRPPALPSPSGAFLVEKCLWRVRGSAGLLE